MNVYSLFLSLKQWLRQWGIPFLSGFSTFGLLLIAQPPNDCPEAAFIFLLPALVWFSFKPSLKKIVWVFFVSGFAYHIFLIGWDTAHYSRGHGTGQHASFSLLPSMVYLGTAMGTICSRSIVF